MANTTVTVRALRGFRGAIDGKFRTVQAGEIVRVSDFFARELAGSGKAEPVDEAALEQKHEPDAGSTRGARARPRDAAS